MSEPRTLDTLYERFADAFEAKYGVLAPGRDTAQTTGGLSEERPLERWKLWVQFCIEEGAKVQQSCLSVVHDLAVPSDQYEAIRLGQQNFLVTGNYRYFAIGDTVRLSEIDVGSTVYSGGVITRQIVRLYTTKDACRHIVIGFDIPEVVKLKTDLDSAHSELQQIRSVLSGIPALYAGKNTATQITMLLHAVRMYERAATEALDALYIESGFPAGAFKNGTVNPYAVVTGILDMRMEMNKMRRKDDQQEP